MRKSLSITFILSALLLTSCDERPSERRARSFAENERGETPSGELSETRQIQLTKQTSLRLDIEYNGGYLTIERDDSGLLADIRLDFREPNSEQPDIRINSGAAATKATGLCNANFRRLDFNGGVGASDLSFDGEWKSEARVDMNLGVGKNEIFLARHVGAKVRPAGSFLSPIGCAALPSAAACIIPKITIKPPAISISTSKWASGIRRSIGLNEEVRANAWLCSDKFGRKRT